VMKEYEPIGVLLADSQRARMYVFALGELVEHSERFEPLPRDEGARGQLDRGGDHPSHLEARVQQHLRNAASVAFEVWRQHKFQHLVIAAPDQLLGELTASLHPYLVERLVPERVSLPVASSEDAVLATAQTIEADVERRRDAEVVERLREAVASKRRGVAGLAPVLEALTDRRVDQLVVSKGFSAPGWRCDGCGIHAAIGRRCKRCGEAMVEVGDIVEEAVEEALAQSCGVHITVDNPDLDVMGRIGALLRF
jgi:peptide chain release factor subunit 1